MSAILFDSFLSFSFIMYLESVGLMIEGFTESMLGDFVIGASIGAMTRYWGGATGA